MKSKLAAFIYSFSACTFRGITHNPTSSRSILTSLCDKINHCFQDHGFMSSNRFVHSSAIEDDEFSELGPETSEFYTKQIKLFTEKPDCVMKTYPSRGELDGRPVSSRTRPSPKAIIKTMSVITPTSKVKLHDTKKIPDIESPKAIIKTMDVITPTSKVKLHDTKKIPDIESPNSILVKNIISEIGLSELVEAISIHGKVSSASFIVAPSGLRNCNIEFEDVGSRMRAISAGKIAIGVQEFKVHPLGAVDVIAFRIGNIHEETTEYAIHSRCKTIGEFMGLARTSKDAVEAFFNVRNDSNYGNILESLNNTVIDHKQWSAHVVANKPAASNPLDDGARHKLGMQILGQIPELRRQNVMKKMHLEDLETLIATIMHIEEDLPSPVGFSSGSSK